jgi:hypothetical protein
VDLFGIKINVVLLAVLGVLNVPVYILIGWVLFGAWSEFWESIKFWLTPDIISWFRGERWEDAWAETRLLLFVVLCVIAVVVEYLSINKYFFS